MPPKRSNRTSNTHTPPSSPPSKPQDADSTPSTPSTSQINPQALLDEEMPEEDIQHLPNTTTNPTTFSANSSTTTGPEHGRNYNALKSHKGQVYSGMAVGGSHTWNYEPGVWTETKEEPDLWRIEYRTDKKRARKAPRGSGAPVGTEYHWLIVGHQVFLSFYSYRYNMLIVLD